jgi:serpin B
MEAHPGRATEQESPQAKEDGPMERKTWIVRGVCAAFLAGLLLAAGVAPTPAAGVSPDVEAVVTANNQFALELHNQLRARDGNLFFSPYSINKTLAMVYAGARGATAKEMATLLHFTLGPERQHQAFLEARRLINRTLAGGALSFGRPGVELYSSANLWGQRGYGFQRSYLKLLDDCYGARLEEVDFTAPAQAAARINDWVEQQTRHKIKDLIGPDTLNASTRLVLASAIYFKGDWIHPFSKSLTSDQAFRTSARDQVQVPMMSQRDTFGYCEDEQVQVLRMPYKGGNLAMLVVLPAKVDGLADLEKMLTAEKLATWTRGLGERKVDVSFPKFKLIGQMALGDTLATMGMSKAFTPGVADLAGMNDGREPLYVSAVMHKAFVDVNEEGTEAAAATGAAVEGLAISPVRQETVPVFRADHPFVFAIQDVQTGMILFLGRVVQPAGGRSQR